MEGGGGGGQTKMEKWSHTLGQGSRGVMRAAGRIAVHFLLFVAISTLFQCIFYTFLVCKSARFKQLMIREAFPPKNAEFYEKNSQTGRGVQPDFISLIQKYICTQKYS